MRNTGDIECHENGHDGCITVREFFSDMRCDHVIEVMERGTFQFDSAAFGDPVNTVVFQAERDHVSESSPLLENEFINNESKNDEENERGNE